MTTNIDIIRDLLRSVAERRPASSEFDKNILNAHRKLILDAGLSEGRGFSRDPHLVRNEQAYEREYDLGPLTISGQRFVALAADDLAWARAKTAYEAVGCNWSLEQLYNFLENQVRR